MTSDDTTDLATYLESLVLGGRHDWHKGHLMNAFFRERQTPGASVAVGELLSGSREAGLQITVETAPLGSRSIYPNMQPVSTDTLFQAASISKAVQSFAVLRFWQDGIFKSLDDPVTAYLPEASAQQLVQNATDSNPLLSEAQARKLLERVTIAHLLSHTGGTTVAGFAGYPYSEAASGRSALDILTGGPGCNSVPVRSVSIPGLTWSYSGGGSTVLQHLLTELNPRRAAGETYPQLMQRLVLAPLGMTRSFYGALPKDESNFSHAHLHGRMRINEDAVPVHSYPELGAAGLWTTAGDLVHGLLGFTATLLGLRSDVLQPQTAREVLRRHEQLKVNGASNGGYYFGLHVAFVDDDKDADPRDKGKVIISHQGGNAGFLCHFAAVFNAADAFDEAGKASGAGSPCARAVAVMTNSDQGDMVRRPICAALAQRLDLPNALLVGTNLPFATQRVAERDALEPWAGTWALAERDGQTLTLARAEEEGAAAAAGTDAGGWTVAFSHLGEDLRFALRHTAYRARPGGFMLALEGIDTYIELRVPASTTGEQDGKHSLSLVVATMSPKYGAVISCSRTA